MRIFVIGTRGIPDIPGGVERHCQELYPRLAELGAELCVSRRSSYVGNNQARQRWEGVELKTVFAPRRKSLEAIVHSFLSLLAARRWRADVVHIHAIGPGLLAPVARLMGFKVVFTHHGPDYDRQKWGKMAKRLLRLGEYLGCRYAHEIVVISRVIQRIVRERTGRDSHLIFNGVTIPEIEQSAEYLKSQGLRSKHYLLAVARLVPEKGLHDLLDAFECCPEDMDLVIAGGADYEDTYSKGLVSRADGNPRIHMPGYVRGRNLAQLLSHARLFVMPSYHEGLPIALLEALSYGLPVVVSDIPANLEVGLDNTCYFPVGNTDALCASLQRRLARSWSQDDERQARQFVAERYDWERIANQTLDVYHQALGPSGAETGGCNK